MIKNYLSYTECLKHLYRTGWLHNGLKAPETVAAHSWQMAMLALYLSTKTKDDYDFDKVIQLCLCHDLGESIIGDITPHENNYLAKEKIEKIAVDKIADECDCNKIKELFYEYEEKRTPESKLANDLDKLDMLIQALDYEKKYPNKDFKEFKQSAIAKITTPLGKEILKELMK